MLKWEIQARRNTHAIVSAEMLIIRDGFWPPCEIINARSIYEYPHDIRRGPVESILI